MSHVVTITTEIRDTAILPAVCERLGLDPPREASVKFFSGTARGTVVQLPGWRYPVVIEPDGTLRYDNYEGRWGDLGRLQELRQAYAVEKVYREAQRLRYRVSENRRADGSVRLVLTR